MGDINKKDIQAKGIKFFIERDGQEVARAYLYLMGNDLHGPRTFGYLEDVFVDEACRGQGLGKQIVAEVMAEAKRLGCYKIVATSRYGRDNVHLLYEKLGFEDFGKEFKIYF